MDRRNMLIIWDRIGDYHRARIRAMEARLEPGSVFTADFGGADELYGWKSTDASDRHFALSEKPVDQLDILTRVGRFRRLLTEKRISRVAIAGYGRPEYVLFIILARLCGCRITLLAESWYGDNPIKNRIKGLFLRLFCHRFLVSGERARDHFRDKLGIPEDRIQTGYSTVDNDHFSCEPGGPRERVLLSVARFSPEKHLDLLIPAFLGSSLAGTCKLRLIGGGPEKDRLVRLAGDNPAVEFADWVSYDELPREYGRASYFILPSRFEPWGLVVNEAMAAGLPVIVSDACGCQPDLVEEGNGRVFCAGSRESLMDTLERLPEPGTAEWESMSKRSLEIVARFSCEVWASKLILTFQ
jgi:1,2-diacylglycerol 3-alpha-glucosyltransferase